MKTYNPLYYLLFILLIMGTFASMAQNSYGLNIIGAVAFIFGLLFLIEIISLVRKKKETAISAFIEPGCLFIIFVVLGLRVFYVHFSYVEWFFGAAVSLLIIFYCMKMITRFRYYQTKNRLLSVLVIVFHLSIIFFLASLALVLLASSLAEVAGVAAIVLLIGFILAAWLKKKVLVEGTDLSPFKMVAGFKGHSIILAVLTLLFSLYFGLNRVGVLPPIYSDEYPKAYFELIDQSATGKEKPVNGKYKYQEFIEKYHQFLRDNNRMDQ